MQLINFKSAECSGNVLAMDYDNGWIKVTAYTDDIIRVQVGPKRANPAPEGYAIAQRNWEPVSLIATSASDHAEISTSKVQVKIHKDTARIEFCSAEGTKLTGSTPWWNDQYCGSKNASGEDEHFFGFGLQFHSLDQRGKLRTIKTNADPPADSGNAHAPDPFFYSTRGYGLFLNSYGYSNFDMCWSRPDEYTFSAPEKTLDYFFIYGPSFRRISELQTLLRGRLKMPAKWGLGFWYRMPSEWKADQTIESAKEFRDRDIPCDVIGLEPKWQTHTYPCTYVWNKEYYPDPKEYVKWMRDNGFHVNLWEHEWVHEDAPFYDELKKKGLLADKKAMGGAVPDFTFQETRNIFAKQHIAEHIEIGIDGYKLDECDGSDYTPPWFYPDDTQFPSGLTGSGMHNLTGFLYSRAFHEMFEKLGMRTYFLLRATFAGGQAHPSCIYSDYYQLNQYIRAQATSGFSGFLWCPELREAKSDEEFIRRAQNMFFSPLAMINAWAGDESLQPWKLGEEPEKIFRDFAKLRMRLLPYIYSSFYRMCMTGLPIVRALVMDYPTDSLTYEVDDQFMFGESMLIAPVESGSSRDVYLPEGKWTDFWTDVVYDGNCKITRETPLDTIPVFVKAGGIIPMAQAMRFVGEKPVDEIELHVYPGNGSITIYDDDGVTTNYQRGEYISVPICMTESRVEIGEARGDYTSECKTIRVIVHKNGNSNEVDRVPFGKRSVVNIG
ncbi:MAG: TIM-barrel domain-containing protein [Armatimonadota bacterium]